MIDSQSVLMGYLVKTPNQLLIADYDLWVKIS